VTQLLSSGHCSPIQSMDRSGTGKGLMALVVWTCILTWNKYLENWIFVYRMKLVQYDIPITRHNETH
jgi:hypothetical protein